MDISSIDKTEIEKNLRKYLPTQLKFESFDIKYEESEYTKLKGKIFQYIVIFKQNEFIPFVSDKEHTKLKSNSIYVRRGTETTLATFEEIQKMLNERIKLEYNNSSMLELNDHFKQLKYLYTQINKTKNILNPEYMDVDFDYPDDTVITVRNKLYPKLDYEQFVSKMIELKFSIIEKEVKK